MSKDIIYREDAIRAICSGCLEENQMCMHHWDCPILTNLGRLSSADRPQGEWIDLQTFDEWYGHAYQCSVCGRDGLNWDFCPNCGARMKGADDETD